MTGCKCARCGAEDSMFWYPYAFGVAPIPSVTDRCIDRSQYFMLCDSCQSAFVSFMHMKLHHCQIQYLNKVLNDNPESIKQEGKE